MATKQQKTKSQIRRRKKSLKTPPLDKHSIQKAAANALLSSTPATISQMCKDLDPELGYELVYAAANQTLQHFERKTLPGNIKPPTDMAVTVRHDLLLLPPRSDIVSQKPNLRFIHQMICRRQLALAKEKSPKKKHLETTFLNLYQARS